MSPVGPSLAAGDGFRAGRGRVGKEGRRVEDRRDHRRALAAPGRARRLPGPPRETCDFTWTGAAGTTTGRPREFRRPVGPPTSGATSASAATRTLRANMPGGDGRAAELSGNGKIDFTADRSQGLPIDSGHHRDGQRARSPSPPTPRSSVPVGPGTSRRASAPWSSPSQAIAGAGWHRAHQDRAAQPHAGRLSFPLGGIVFAGSNALTVTQSNSLGSGTPVTLVDGAPLNLSTTTALNLGNGGTKPGRRNGHHRRPARPSRQPSHTRNVTVPAAPESSQAVAGWHNTSLPDASASLSTALRR